MPDLLVDICNARFYWWISVTSDLLTLFVELHLSTFYLCQIYCHGPNFHPVNLHTISPFHSSFKRRHVLA